MPDHGWTHEDVVVIGWIVVLTGLIVLSQFGVAITILVSILGGSVLVATVLLLWVFFHDRAGRD